MVHTQLGLGRLTGFPLVCLNHERAAQRQIQTILLFDYDPKGQSQSGACRDLRTGSDPTSHVDKGATTPRFGPQHLRSVRGHGPTVRRYLRAVLGRLFH